MRHLSSFIAGIVIGIVAWILIGWSLAKIGIRATAGIEVHSWNVYWLPLLLLAIAGLLIGLVTSTRISPAGALIAGAAYVGLQIVYVFAPNFLNWLPGNVFGQHQIWTRPLSTGIAALLGLVMLTAVLSVRRWQRWPTGRHARVAEEAAPVGTRTTDTEAGHFPMSERRSGAAADEQTPYTTPAEGPVAGTPTAEQPTIGRPPGGQQRPTE